MLAFLGRVFNLCERSQPTTIEDGELIFTTPLTSPTTRRSVCECKLTFPVDGLPLGSRVTFTLLPMSKLENGEILHYTYDHQKVLATEGKVYIGHYFVFAATIRLSNLWPVGGQSRAFVLVNTGKPDIKISVFSY